MYDNVLVIKKQLDLVWLIAQSVGYQYKDEYSLGVAVIIKR